MKLILSTMFYHLCLSLFSNCINISNLNSDSLFVNTCNHEYKQLSTGLLPKQQTDLRSHALTNRSAHQLEIFQISYAPSHLYELRFIDDIDMKWIHGKETLEAFLETANSFHSTIRFTAEVSNDKHVFLDTMSHLADDKFAVDLYTKPTDSHQYLLPTSCHPPHCSKNIP